MFEVYFYGLGYGGNVILVKKCFVLCIVLVIVCDEGWFVEYMLFICVIDL